MSLAPASGSTDPLLQALVWLCRRHGQERTPQSLLHSVPADGRLRPEQAVQVLRDAGFNATVLERPLPQLLSLLMPAVLLMNNGEALVVTRRLAPERRGDETRYEVLLPGENEATREVAEAELLSEYSGHVLVASLPAGGVHSAHETTGAAGHWLWGTLRRFAPYYRSAMLAALLSNVLMLATGLFTSVVYDRVIPHQAFVTLWALAGGALLAVVFDLAARQLRSYLIDLAGKKADLALGAALFRQTLGLRLEHRPESAGAFAHHVTQIEVVRDFSASATVSALTDLPFIGLFVAMTWFVAGPLVLVLVLAIPLVLCLSWGVQSLLRRYVSANLKQHADLHGVLIEAVEGLEDLRAAGAQGHFLQRHEQANAAAAHTALQARALSSWVNNVAMVSQQLVTVAMLVWGVHLIADQQLTGGALIAAVMFGTRAIAPLGSVVSLASRYQGARAALRSLNELMAWPTEREPGKRYLPRPALEGRLGLHGVQFAYPKGTRAHAPLVLKGVSLVIQPGERVAILGKIGSGKSTILRLLAGLYQPTEGLAEADGLDLRQIDPADFRAQVGFVSQEPRLFQGSLKDNILMGRPHADAERFIAVTRLTGLDRIAAAHPMGFDLPVGEMGGLLSGGQRQLVALARCLVTRPQVLLLDEPTSSMDAQAEAGFIHHLRTALDDRTLVVVTHRPALLSLVDRVVVVDNGRILADGPKAQVLAMLSGQPAAAAAPARPAAPESSETAPPPLDKVAA
ncbi:type I secretion system permease/ATPase [Aquabacterium sp. A7-Y]|uniref:type I secretion system permease/ATPase n=1 Tax=Aquabacterium sp. A7-Y TaxID=1349605 RepID=UPI00223D6A88|nr:type I secretion system permease/ATPase [Aquabacterium sp. A7-Y]MCW7541854.1 type I secretion system permease/ATPase [Aquabacterium sp. A7-Y]